MTREGVTVPSGTSMLELGAGKGALSYSLYQSFVPRRQTGKARGFEA
ncbi:MAG: hypothetical protein ABSB26_01390 [Nitrososphaerales archaeon]